MSAEDPSKLTVVYGVAPIRPELNYTLVWTGPPLQYVPPMPSGKRPNFAMTAAIGAAVICGR